MKYLFIPFYLLLISNLFAQKTSLSDILWKEVGGRIYMSEDHGGEYVISDDAANGYLNVAFTEDGCGCYYETTMVAYKDLKGDYTTLKMYWDGCQWKKLFASNRNLIEVLPKDFGLITFMPRANENNGSLKAILYLEANLPREGTDTKIDLAYIPFGLNYDGVDRVLSYNGYSTLKDKHRYNGDLKEFLQNLTDSETLLHIQTGEFDKIAPIDKKHFDKLFPENKKHKSAQALIHNLKDYYKISKAIKYKSIILGWDRKEARFYIKEKIKNDAPEQSFLEFVQQLPFLMAVC